MVVTIILLFSRMLQVQASFQRNFPLDFRKKWDSLQTKSPGLNWNQKFITSCFTCIGMCCILNGIRAVFLNVYLKTQMKGSVNTANTSKKDLQNQ